MQPTHVVDVARQHGLAGPGPRALEELVHGLRGYLVADGRMGPLPAVVDLDELDDRVLGLGPGDEWQAFRTEPQGKMPVTKHVFTVRISDEDMKPAEKARLFYLFSEEANRKKEIEDYY